MAATAARTASTLSQASERAVFTPISSRRCLKRRRSSVSRTVSTGVPSTRTPYFASMPRSSRATPQLSAVWPPKETVIASTSSFWMTSSTTSGSTGRKYTLSAIASLVWMVAMLGLMRTVWMPSSRSALMACEPE